LVRKADFGFELLAIIGPACWPFFQALKQTCIRFVAAFCLPVGLIGASPIAQVQSGTASEALARSVKQRQIHQRSLYEYQR
jgi:hypothetical protein